MVVKFLLPLTFYKYHTFEPLLFLPFHKHAADALILEECCQGTMLDKILLTLNERNLVNKDIYSGFLCDTESF